MIGLELCCPSNRGKPKDNQAKPKSGRDKPDRAAQAKAMHTNACAKIDRKLARKQKRIKVSPLSTDKD